MNFITKIKAFRDLTEDNFDYIANTATILGILSFITVWLYKNFSSISFFSQIIIIGIVLFLMFILRRNIKNTISKVFNEYQLIDMESNFQAQSKVISANSSKINFEKIVPKTAVIKHLLGALTKLAKKQLATDVCSTHTYISISYNNNGSRNKKNRFSISGNFNFCSPSKNMSISYYTTDLKVPKQTTRNLSYSNGCNLKEHFTKDSHWRDAVIEALERTEAALVGRSSFQCVIENSLVGYTMDCIIYPYGSPVSKSYFFGYANNKLYEGTIPENKIVKSFGQ